MTREGSEVCTKPRRRGLEKSKVSFTSTRNAKPNSPLSDPLGELGSGFLDAGPADELGEVQNGHQPDREEDEQGHDDEDLADEDRARREAQIEPLNVARFRGCER